MRKKEKIIAVIDGQGGGIGKQIVEGLKEELGKIPELENEVIVRALGTNSQATARMLKAGADDGATGENAIICNAKNADIIIGVVAIVVPNSMLGELSSRMAEAIGESSAYRILIPINRCNTRIAVIQEGSLQQYIERAVEMAKEKIMKDQ
jgi:hypothetical protein